MRHRDNDPNGILYLSRGDVVFYRDAKDVIHTCLVYCLQIRGGVSYVEIRSPDVPIAFVALTYDRTSEDAGRLTTFVLDGRPRFYLVNDKQQTLEVP